MENTVSPTPASDNSPVEKQLLFRQEILAAQSSQWLGAIRLAQPISTWFIVVSSLCIAACIVAYVIFGDITKKARVAGITVPCAGSLSIAAPNAGILMHSRVREGQEVRGGQVLFELSTERQGSQGEITVLVAQQLAIRAQTLAAERRTHITQDAEKRRALDARALNLEAEIAQLEQEIALAQRRMGLSQRSVEKYETLQNNGFVSAIQAQQKQEDLIDLDARLSSLARTKVQLEANRLGLKAERQDLANNLATELTQLERAEASLNQEVAENQNRKSSLIVAPEAGTVTTITYQPGQAVNSGQVLATLVPVGDGNDAKHSDLEVDLFAPSRTAGFVGPGQTVLIRYQAFPYQKFGLYEGFVIDVSKTPFAPNELPANLASTILSNAQQSMGANGNEGLYRVKVRLAQQSIIAYGKPQPLKPGMTLEADIVQDKRRIWEWVLEPLLAVVHR